MNDHQKRNPRLRQTVIVAVCVLAVLLFLYLLLRDRPGSASDYLDDSAPYTFDSSASRTFRTDGQPPRGRVLERSAAAR